MDSSGILTNLAKFGEKIAIFQQKIELRDVAILAQGAARMS